jgi:RNA polymerase sigma factor (sigma-70 family)
MVKKTSFNSLVGRFSPRIKRIAYKLNGRYRSFDHDDLYQEALLHLWNASRSNKLADKTDSYILQGCYFHLKNCIRKINEKPNTLSLESMFDAQNDSSAADALLNRHVVSRDMRDQLDVDLVAGAISNNGFSPKEKRIIFSLSEGLTTRQIGRRLGVSHVSVVKALKKIRRKSSRHIDKF